LIGFPVLVRWILQPRTHLGACSVAIQTSDYPSSRFACAATLSLFADLKVTIEQIFKRWQTASKPLIAFLITYEISGRKRRFKELQTYRFAEGKYKKIRFQPALPWEVNRAKANNESEDAS